jgi:colicin import membrane protein
MNDKAEKAEESAAEDDGKVSIKVDQDKYVSTKSASGKKSQRRDDAVAEALDGLTVNGVYKVADTILEEDFREKYSHLNVGMQRMNVGNRLRAWVSKGEVGDDRAKTLAEACKPHKPVSAEKKEEKAKSKAKK